MKIYLLLIVMFAFGANAQISQNEFDEQMSLSNTDGEKALSNLKNLESKYPNDAKVLFLRGFYSFRDGDTNAAMMQFSQSIKAAPDFAFAYGGRAQLFADKGMMEKAIADISEAIKLQPDNTSLLNSRAGYYYQTKQFTEGLEDMKMKIKLEPNDVMSYYDAAIFSKEVDPNYDSDSFLKQASAEPGIPTYVSDAVYGQFLLNQGRYEEAKIKYEASLATNEKDFDATDFEKVAMVYYKTKDIDKAISYYIKAIALVPNNVGYQTNLAGIYLEKGDWQKMKETSEAALALNSEDKYANMYMSVALFKTGNEEKAAEYQAKAKRIEAQEQQ